MDSFKVSSIFRSQTLHEIKQKIDEESDGPLVMVSNDLISRMRQHDLVGSFLHKNYEYLSYRCLMDEMLPSSEFRAIEIQHWLSSIVTNWEMRISRLHHFFLAIR